MKRKIQKINPRGSRLGRPKGKNVENAHRRRKQIIDAVVLSIVENGLSATTFTTVAQASGLSQGTAVFYFQSKEKLLAAAFRDRMQKYRTAWMDALSSAGPDPVDRIVAMVFGSLHPSLLTYRELAFWNSFWPEASKFEHLNATLEQGQVERNNILESLCEDARKLISGTIWTPRTVAQASENMVEGVWTRLYYSSGEMSVRDARITVGALLASIFPSRAADIMRHATEFLDEHRDV
jgi:AcrR family transcriptional regulator